MKYQILTVRSNPGNMATDFEKAAVELSELVNQAIRDGWEPLGGVAVGNTQATMSPYLFQAMTHD